VDFLESAYRRAAPLVPGGQVVADTYLSPGLRAGVLDPAHLGPLGTLGYYGSDTATPILEGTYEAARRSVDVAMTAAQAVLDGERSVYGLCRPPGHHAAEATFAGYCYFNNAAVVAQHLSARGRVTVLDIDYHHGNGTQQIFWERGDVQYVSLHGDPARAYPYFSGYDDEIGQGNGRGSTLNLPLQPGTDDVSYLNALGRAVDAIDGFGPAVIVMSLGVDTHVDDPLGDLAVTTDGFARQGKLIAELERPIVVLQEGGYDLATIGANVRGFLGALTAQ
jgi:acetoin utilization deacetylase AcuC-like enzyme